MATESALQLMLSFGILIVGILTLAISRKKVRTPLTVHQGVPTYKLDFRKKADSLTGAILATIIRTFP
ncbi:putative holin-like toxin [Bacillus swezeyi]|uniref:putative holin-like toxin n=1 Tax=Bacillus swezeyi TaxID=1925020 RepID=UPI002E23EC19|nr:putative holin-like toxin [Bacillus swezeyi]